MHTSAYGAEGLAEDLQTRQTGRSGGISLLRLIIQRAIRVLVKCPGLGEGGCWTDAMMRDPIISLRVLSLYALHLKAKRSTT